MVQVGIDGEQDDFLTACFNGDEIEAFRLLEEGADAAATNRSGQTALHLLVKGLPCCDECNAQLWRRELVRVLVETDGVDPLKKDNDGMTARDHALFMGFPNLVRELRGLEIKHKRALHCPLRFEVGDRVEASVEEGYRRGTVIKQWDEGNAYRVRLDSALEVWAPLDKDAFVRPLSTQSMLLEAEENERGEGHAADATTSTSAVSASAADDPNQFDDDGPDDEEADELIRAMSEGFSLAGDAAPTERIKLNPEIYDNVKSMAKTQMSDAPPPVPAGGGGGAGSSQPAKKGGRRRGGKKKKK